MCLSGWLLLLVWFRYTCTCVHAHACLTFCLNTMIILYWGTWRCEQTQLSEADMSASGCGRRNRLTWTPWWSSTILNFLIVHNPKQKIKQQIAYSDSSKACRQWWFQLAVSALQVFHSACWQACQSQLRPGGTCLQVLSLSNVMPCDWLKKTALSWWMATYSVLAIGGQR